MELALVLALGLMAGTLGGIVGFGSSIMLMPALALAFGAQEAVPIMAVAALLANASRVAAWWSEIRWNSVAAYSATAIPGAALGAATLVALPGDLVEAGLGAFFLLMVPLRHWMAARRMSLGLRGLAVAGLPIGFITGMVASTGPVNSPLFLAHGLVKGAYLGTEAMASIAMYLAKLATFRGLDALPAEAVVQGLVVGSSLFAGAFIAKRFVRRLDADRFRMLMDGLLVLAGLTLLGAALA